jgi:hypothetical protein
VFPYQNQAFNSIIYLHLLELSDCMYLHNPFFVLGVYLVTGHRYYRRACEHVDVGTCPHQVLAATLTLSQPGGTEYAHPILVSTQNFESHRRAWIRII